jgi:hypothetical protein
MTNTWCAAHLPRVGCNGQVGKHRKNCLICPARQSYANPWAKLFSAFKPTVKEHLNLNRPNPPEASTSHHITLWKLATLNLRTTD